MSSPLQFCLTGYSYKPFELENEPGAQNRIYFPAPLNVDLQDVIGGPLKITDNFDLTFLEKLQEGGRKVSRINFSPEESVFISKLVENNRKVEHVKASALNLFAWKFRVNKH